MTAEQWTRITELFHQAASLPPHSRRTYLTKACGGDTLILEEVLTLLDNLEPAEDFFDGWQEDLQGNDQTEGPLSPGTRLGPYEVEEEIGRGGMSVVYRALRVDGAFTGKVAIKVLKKGLDTAAILQRFRYEQQLLADLRHPGIASLLDGGETAQGQPYLVMEFIEGQDLLRATEGLSEKEKLRLFLQVLAAVQHAHQQLVVHRDLKPANILVAEGQVKLLDFGIAKLLDPQQTGLTTGPEQRLLTPEYAAPEQLTGGRISTATDVYQLGTVLFELLCGERPAGPASLPSQQAGHREQQRELRGDLDQVVAMARRSEPERRYASAAALARDLEAWLENRPVQARPEHWAYLTRKFVQRNRGLVAIAALLLLTLVGGILATSYQAQRAREALVRETEAREEAEAVTDYLVSVFSSADPYRRGDAVDVSELTLRDVLDESLPGLRTDLAEQPRIQIKMLGILNQLYDRLSERQKGYQIAREALALTQQEFGPASTEYATGLLNLANAAQNLEYFEEADSLFQLAIPTYKAAYGTQPRQLEVVYNDYGLMRYALGDVSGSDSLFALSLEVMALNDFPDTANYAQTLVNRVDPQQAMGQLETGYELSRKAVTLLEAGGYENSVFMAHARTKLAQMLLGLDSAEVARSQQELALKTFRQVLGEQSHFVALSHYILGNIEENLGNYAAQEEHIALAMEIIEALYGPTNTNLAIMRTTLGKAQHAQGRLEEAIRNFSAALALMEKTGSLRDIDIIQVNLARTLMALGRDEEAGRYVQMARAFQAEHPQMTRNKAAVRLYYALWLRRQGQDEAARTTLSEARDLLKEISPTHPLQKELAEVEELW